MAGFQVDFDKADIPLLLVVGKGLTDISLLVNHGQAARHPGQQGALNEHGQQDNAEHQVVEVIGCLNAAEHRRDGEHDGGCAPQTGPGHHPHLSQRRTEGQQQRAGHQGPRSNREEEHDGQSGQQHLGQLHRRHQQAQQEEDDHLGHTSDHVEEVDQVLFLGHSGVAQHNAAQVHAQVSVSAPHGGQGVGQKHHAEEEHGAALLGGKQGFAQEPHRQSAHHQPADSAQHQLLGQQQGDGHLLPGHEGDEDGGQHVGHGVVGARLHLQQGVGVVLEGQLLGAEDVEHGGRVGGGDH